jgi:hypothetical protein
MVMIRSRGGEGLTAATMRVSDRGWGHARMGRLRAMGSRGREMERDEALRDGPNNIIH